VNVNAKKSPAAAAHAFMRAASMTPAERTELARKGGEVGGKARAAKLTAAQWRKIATIAAQARWAQRKKDKV
jgi:hypothetical protein